MTLSEKIKALRSEKRLSVRGLAKEVSVTPMHISNLENNKTNASPELIKKIAIALETDSDELLHLSSQVDPEVIDVIKSNAKTIPSFLRSAKDLTPEQWEQLNSMVDTFK